VDNDIYTAHRSCGSINESSANAAGVQFVLQTS